MSIFYPFRYDTLFGGKTTSVSVVIWLFSITEVILSLYVIALHSLSNFIMLVLVSTGLP